MQWVGVLLVLLSLYLLGRKSHHGWFASLLASTLFASIFFAEQNWPQTALSVVYIVFAAHNFVQWAESEKEPTACSPTVATAAVVDVPVSPSLNTQLRLAGIPPAAQVKEQIKWIQSALDLRRRNLYSDEDLRAVINTIRQANGLPALPMCKVSE